MAKTNIIKDSMRSEVMSLYSKWVKTTKPSGMNIVSLPGNSFEFERHVIDNRPEKLPTSLFLFENKNKIYRKNLDAVELHICEMQLATHYIRANIPPIESFKSLPTFAWYDYCGTPTKDQWDNLTGEVHRNTVLVITFNGRVRRKDLLADDINQFAKKKVRNHLNAIEKGVKKSLTKKLPHLLFSHQYRSDQGTPMIMLALTNSLTLAKRYHGIKRKTDMIQPNVTEKIQENIRSIYFHIHTTESQPKSKLSEEKKAEYYIWLKDHFQITSHQLAGFKRTYTIKKEQGKLTEYLFGDLEKISS